MPDIELPIIEQLIEKKEIVHSFENAEKSFFGDRLYSPSVTVGGVNFRILFFPRGNRSETNISAFCDLDKTSTPATDDPEFEVFTYFSIAVLRRDGTKWFSRCKTHI